MNAIDKTPKKQAAAARSERQSGRALQRTRATLLAERQQLQQMELEARSGM